MALKKEIQIKVDGKYLKGSITGQVYRSGGLVHILNDKNTYTLETIEGVIEELTELANLLNGSIIADKLAPEDDCRDQM